MNSSSTVFTLKNCNPSHFISKITPVETTTPKQKYDVLNPGKPIQLNNAGGVSRVLQRGEVYCKDGNPYERDCGKSCWWHRHPFEGLAMGIPIRVVIKSGVRKIYMDGFFCSYACTLAFLEEELKKTQSRRDPNYSQSKTLLLQLFEEEFPGEKLLPALDWKMMKDVGNGNLNLREYLSGMKGIRLVQHPNCSFTPVTITYDIVSEKS